MTTLNTFIPEIRQQVYSHLDGASLAKLSLVSKIFYQDLTNDPFFKNKFLKENPIFETIHEKLFKELIFFHPTCFWKAVCMRESLPKAFYASAFPLCVETIKAQHKVIKEQLQKSCPEEAKAIYEQYNSEFFALKENYGNPQAAIDENGPGFIDQINGLIEQGKTQGKSEEETLANLNDPRLIPWTQYQKTQEAFTKYNDLNESHACWQVFKDYLENAIKKIQHDPEFLLDTYTKFFHKGFEKAKRLDNLQKIADILSKEEGTISDSAFDKIKSILPHCGIDTKGLFHSFLDDSYRGRVKKEMLFLSIETLSETIEKNKKLKFYLLTNYIVKEIQKINSHPINSLETENA